MPFPPRRTVIQAEARAWLAANPAAPGTSVITSLPDVSELPALGFDGWRRWFVATARQVIGWVPEGGVAIFFQSDVFHQGQWVDKGYLVMAAAEAAGAALAWHKIVCRKPPGTVTLGRSAYSHMICVTPGSRPPRRGTGPDVLPDGGPKSWSKAMGEAACKAACRYLRDETRTTLVVDPFCGQGSALAVANGFGMDALGIDLSPRRCRIAATCGPALQI
jgi:hypothetical protein